MAYNFHDYGDSVRVTAEFNNATTGEAIDPDVVKLSIKPPSGTVTTYTYNTDAEVVRDALGQYHADISATESGTWYYRWWATGNGQSSEERQYTVRAAQAVES